MYVGVDVVSANEVSRSLERFGERYVRRVFTPGEAAYCRAATGRVAAERFAARFAAKEATLKAVRPDTTAIDWRSIEIRRHASGWCDVVLHGEAAAAAQDRLRRQSAQGAGSGADGGHDGCGVDETMTTLTARYCF
jgi:holo-[acyl-carrier protein] synthase